jgi:hypothetical protein
MIDDRRCGGDRPTAAFTRLELRVYVNQFPFIQPCPVGF